jgi:hypothetical protein
MKTILLALVVLCCSGCVWDPILFVADYLVLPRLVDEVQRATTTPPVKDVPHESH